MHVGLFEEEAPDGDGQGGDLVGTPLRGLGTGGFQDSRCEGDPGDYDVPFRKPELETLQRHRGKYGLSQQEADAVAGKWSPRSTVPAAIFLHIQGTCGRAGTTAGSLQHWAGRGGVGGAQASSSVMVQEDGSLLRVIEDCNAPWTNGDFSSGTERGWQLRNRMGGGINSNDYSLTIEAEGGPANDLTEEALETVCWMCAVWMKRWGLTVDDIYRHADWDQTTRCFCPGTYFDTVIARLQAAGLS